MARRPGLKGMPLSSVPGILARERAGSRDLHAPLARYDVDVAEPLGAPERRFVLRERGGTAAPIRFSPTALSQLCTITGVPAAFVERAPAPFAAKALRCFLEMSADAGERLSLMRLKEAGGGGAKQDAAPTLRAILPHSYVRLDDADILADVREALKGSDATVAGVSVDDDLFSLRLVLGEPLDLGTARHPDPAYAGIDVISSETGCHQLEVRWVLIRVICKNGMTGISDAQLAMKSRYTRMDRASFRSVFRDTLDDVVKRGRDCAGRLAGERANMVENPAREIEKVLRHFDLGSPRGRLGRWVLGQALRSGTLWGVQRFEIVQAFTLVAQGLEPRARRKVEDAMGGYLLHGLMRASKAESGSS